MITDTDREPAAEVGPALEEDLPDRVFECPECGTKMRCKQTKGFPQQFYCTHCSYKEDEEEMAERTWQEEKAARHINRK